ncbi:peptide-methionine (R)-S-oxide reductase [Niastella vici]|uniref:Peptide methionine sulfoxide reductase MsrB n=2 Tax=Niastella vici TaxID=1703345 RepID=A0A1V9G552_9BACT|nr:peptide-methionine (R)-S-oxide reductase [Niastella vici]
MKRIIQILFLLLLTVSFQQCSYSQSNTTKKENMDTSKKNPVYSRTDSSKVNITDEEWRKILPADVYSIAREKGTERPWTSKFEDSKEVGTYYCAACGNPLFKSDTKFESGCGWPSFYQPISKSSIIYLPDNSHGMQRTEVECGRCKAHLGHVFEDGPPPTGLRYCINGVVLDFEKAKAAEKKYNEGSEQSKEAKKGE